LSIAVALVVGGVGAEAHDKLSEAQSSFFNARYNAAAESALEARELNPEDLAAIELRASALLFQLKAALGERPDKDKDKTFKQCVPCPDLLAQFLSETSKGQELAR